MKNFKQICLMSIMLSGGSAFGMNYLKPALCGGLVGGALNIWRNYGSLREKINEKRENWIFYLDHFCDDITSLPKKNIEKEFSVRAGNKTGTLDDENNWLEENLDNSGNLYLV